VQSLFNKLELIADFSIPLKSDNDLNGPSSLTVSLSHTSRSRMSCDADRLLATGFCAPYRMCESSLCIL